MQATAILTSIQHESGSSSEPNAQTKNELKLSMVVNTAISNINSKSLAVPKSSMLSSARNLLETVAQIVDAHNKLESVQKNAVKIASLLQNLINHTKYRAAAASGQLKRGLSVLTRAIQEASEVLLNIVSIDDRPKEQFRRSVEHVMIVFGNEAEFLAGNEPNLSKRTSITNSTQAISTIISTLLDGASTETGQTAMVLATNISTLLQTTLAPIRYENIFSTERL